MRYRNAVLFAALAVAWGSAFTAIKAGLSVFPPVLFAALRYDAAGVVILVYAASVSERWRPRTRADWLAVTVGGVLMIAAYHAFLFVGEQNTTSAAAAVIVSLSPILTAGFARALLPDDRLSALGVVGLTIGFAGVVVLSQPDPSRLGRTRTVAQLLVLAAAASFALGSVLTRLVDDDLSIETMEAWSMLVGAVLLHVVSLLLGEPVAPETWLTPVGIGSLGFLVVVASAAGFLIYFDLLERLGPIEINLVSYAAPVVAAATGFLLLGERPTPATAAGFVLILAGFLLVKRRAIRSELRRLASG